MACLNTLKEALQRASDSSSRRPLDDREYSAGFQVLLEGPNSASYNEFVIPQLTQLLAPLFNSRDRISILEIGPGQKSVLGALSDHLRRKVQHYAAYEPNHLFASRLEAWLFGEESLVPPFPHLESLPDIRRAPFIVESNRTTTSDADALSVREQYDVVLFCHSLYGLKPEHVFVKQAIQLIDERRDDCQGPLVVVFHRDKNLEFGDLVCHRTAVFPVEVIRVADEDEVLDVFAPFIAGFLMQNSESHRAVCHEWRKICRSLAAHHAQDGSGYLSFSSASVMFVFNQHATKLDELTANIPSSINNRNIKNPEARLRPSALIVRPTRIQEVQLCVQWALRYSLSLTVLGGSHSGNCVLQNVVSLDMILFDQISPPIGGDNGGTPHLIVVGAGCNTGDVISTTMARGLTVPMGSRPSVGAGSWLQGGIGHLARPHGLTCDSVVGAVLVSVEKGQTLTVGQVPSQYRPAGSVHEEHGEDLLWAIKGAGTNFGIVISVVLRTHEAHSYLIQKWMSPRLDGTETCRNLEQLNEGIAKQLSDWSSADGFLYSENGHVRLGITLIQPYAHATSLDMLARQTSLVCTTLGPAKSSQRVNGIELFDTEMYMSGTCGVGGGHGGGKTSSFKRCVFLETLDAPGTREALTAISLTSPSSLCYLHLLQGGGAVLDLATSATAFGCRNWAFACVITGVWPRSDDGTEIARTAVRWVYSVVNALLPFSSGVYGADLGQDPRDARLAVTAFGTNRQRLIRLKHKWDPSNVLAHACPLPKMSHEQKLIVLVTGESCAGKDYCASQWATLFRREKRSALAVSISERFKRQYAAAADIDVESLLLNRRYKEGHRAAMTMLYKQHLEKRPWLPEAEFLHVVQNSSGVDVLFITGMRDQAPVANFSHLVPGSRVIEVRVHASEVIRTTRKEGYENNDSNDDTRSTAQDNLPDFAFNNDMTGNEAAERFARRYLIPYLDPSFLQLADLVSLVSDFPSPGIEFKHVLDISQQPGGLSLCISLLKSQFIGHWAQVGSIACCEAGGFIFASALAFDVNVPLALIREAGKLPAPVLSVVRSPSFISNSGFMKPRKDTLEMNKNAITRNGMVVVVDDVLASGQTLCAVLELLMMAGVTNERISVMVIAEFPLHRGRERLRQSGFGNIRVQSLLVYGCF